MPDKPLTVLTYAASASLAAVALIYFFNPNYIIDGEGNTSQLSRRARVNTVIGLYNPANDCFINSVLQALAGLGELRVYLIREIHRRSLDGNRGIYQNIVATDAEKKPVDLRKARSLLEAEVTCGLKEILDRLNERPLQKKVISASSFVAVLESAFATRVNRNQQDAQELLQVVAERMAEEYQAGRAARKRAREGTDVEAKEDLQDAVAKEQDLEDKIIRNQDERAVDVAEGDECQSQSAAAVPTTLVNGDTIQEEEEEATDKLEEEEGFPMEGQQQSQIECEHCHFIPKSAPSSFIMLTLSVPHTKTSSSLNECFDGAFKTEYIDDYRCDRCRLVHAVSVLEQKLQASRDETQQEKLQLDIDRLRKAIEEDPENPPEDIQLPDSRDAPTRRIARSVAITSFPKILVVHLSRSAYDARLYSSKNNAKVVFPERLPLGSLLDRRNYRLLGVVTHKGTHSSGHYETFRRQHIYPPSSTPHNDRQKGPYGSAVGTPQPSPRLGASTEQDEDTTDGQQEDLRNESDVEDAEGNDDDRTQPNEARDSSASTVKTPLSRQRADSPSTTASPRESTSTRPRDSMSTLPTPSSVVRPDSSARSATPSTLDVKENGEGKNLDRTRPSSKQRVRNKIEEVKEQKKQDRRRKQAVKESQRWWRISDDKVKECKTNDVLGMQKEVYMLFYEMEK